MNSRHHAGKIALSVLTLLAAEHSALAAGSGFFAKLLGKASTAAEIEVKVASELPKVETAIVKGAGTLDVEEQLAWRKYRKEQKLMRAEEILLGSRFSASDLAQRIGSTPDGLVLTFDVRGMDDMDGLMKRLDYEGIHASFKKTQGRYEYSDWSPYRMVHRDSIPVDPNKGNVFESVDSALLQFARLSNGSLAVHVRNEDQLHRLLEYFKQQNTYIFEEVVRESSGKWGPSHRNGYHMTEASLSSVTDFSANEEKLRQLSQVKQMNDASLQALAKKLKEMEAQIESLKQVQNAAIRADAKIGAQLDVASQNNRLSKFLDERPSSIVEAAQKAADSTAGKTQ